MKQEYNITNRHGLTMNTVSHTIDTPRGTVIIHHGYVGNTNSPTIQLMRRTFNKLGFNTVTPNTTHNYNDSDGDYREMTLQGHNEDLMDCVKHTVDAQSFTGPLILAGHSAGGHSVLVASAKLEAPYRPALTIASAPLISGERYMDGWRKILPSNIMQQWKDVGFINCGSDSGPDELELHWSVMQDWCNHDLIKDGITPKNPTFLIGGEKDNFITPEDIIDYFESSKIGEVSFIKDGDHCYTEHENAFKQRLEAIISSNFPKP